MEGVHVSPRPALGIGEYGSMHTTNTDGTWTARARFRGLDGKVRQVSATGTTRTKAESALRAKLAVRKQGSSELNSETLIRDLAEQWYQQRRHDGLKYRTLDGIRVSLDRHIIPKLGGLRIREATTARLDAFIQAVVAGNGPGPGRKARSNLSGMFKLAIRYDAAAANPALGTLRPKVARGVVHAMDLQDFLRFRAHAELAVRPESHQSRIERSGGDPRRRGGLNKSHTIVDIIDFLIGTGCRSSEVLGVCWDDVHLDDAVPWVRIHRQVQRQRGVGLVLVPTKEDDVRLLALPAFTVAMLRRRQESEPANKWGAVFTNIRGNLVDSVNMRTVWHSIFDGTEWDWVTPKTLRKTVATIVAAEQGSELAAKQLGHASDAVTKLHYIEASRTPLDQRLSLEGFGV